MLAELRARQQQQGRTLGQVASELLACALADASSGDEAAPLVWSSQPMRARVDLDDLETVNAVLDADR